MDEKIIKRKFAELLDYYLYDGRIFERYNEEIKDFDPKMC
jgi:hypothetical protein